MLEVDVARAKLLEGFSPLDVVEIGLSDAAGMVPARNLVAPHALPRFDNSAMDGYAVIAADTDPAPVGLPLAGEVRAGRHRTEELQPGSVVRIMTGAPVPPGADAIVPVENTTESDGVVVIGSVATAGDHIRPAGDDVHAGAVVVPAGIELGAGELALLASLGLTPVSVHRRPRVAILSTGDELVSPDDEPGPGQIRDSNSLALSILVSDSGGEARVIGPAADSKEAVEAAIDDAASDTDLIVSSGGVSVGKYDFVKEVIETRGRLDFWRVAMQPGKPVVSGAVGRVPFLGLPGNPVSIHIGFEQFVRPALRKMRGCVELLRPTLTARLSTRIEKRPGRLHFVRVRLVLGDEGPIATPIGAQGSHIQSSLVDCHGVARFPVDASILEAGDEVTVEVWRLP
jgi:molybdopterin molybdotransferase